MSDPFSSAVLSRAPSHKEASETKEPQKKQREAQAASSSSSSSASTNSAWLSSAAAVNQLNHYARGLMVVQK